LHLIDQDLERSRTPSPLGQTRLAAKMPEKLLGCGELLPDLGKKGGALPSGPLEDDPVSPRPEQPEQMVSIFVTERFGIGQHRDLHLERWQLACDQRFKTVIVEGGVEGIAFDAVDDAFHGGKTADAAPQIALFMQGDEDTSLMVKGCKGKLLRHNRPVRLDPEMLLNVLPRQANEHLSLLLSEHGAFCWFRHEKGVYSIARFDPVNTIVTEERHDKRLR
jgi:hypothetical protein